MQNQVQNGISSAALTPQLNYTDIIQQLEEVLNTDVQRLGLLVQQGVISNEQGQYFLNLLRQKAGALIQCRKAIPQAQIPQAQNIQEPIQTPITESVENPFDSFNQENPGFFEQAGRGDVLNYIKGLDVDKDEISKIAKLVESVENSAVDGYLKKSAHEKSLNDENSAAKSKLTSYAQTASQSGDMNRIFTRADIGSMSGEEFTKNEKLIMEQAKRGLIK